MMNQKKRRRSDFYYFAQSEFVESEIPVPFYVKGSGIMLVEKGKIEQQRGSLNPSCGFLWILSGEMEICDGPRRILAGRNHVCFSLSGENLWHRIVSDECVFRWVALAGPFADAILHSYRYSHHQIARHPYPKALFRRLDSLMNNDSPFTTRVKAAIALEILAYAAGDDPSVNENLRIVDNALTLIRQNLANTELGVNFLCERLKISPATLNRVFQNQLECSPGRLILDRRLRLGMGLLAGSDQSIAEIAVKCGFRNTKTFSRFVRRGTGVSARDFRLRQQSGNPVPFPGPLPSGECPVAEAWNPESDPEFRCE